MKLSQNKHAGYTIQAYTRGEIRISRPGMGEATVEDSAVTSLTFNRNLIITPQALIEDWSAASPDMLTGEDLNMILELKPEIVLLGTGSRITFPAAELIQQIQAAGCGLETMDTGAACRTYNLLASEGRQVCAGLFLL